MVGKIYSISNTEKDYSNNWVRVCSKMTKERSQLLKEVTKLLVEAGFNLSSECDIRPSCFDFVAGREGQILLVKVLSNIDALTEEDARILQLVARFFNGTPIIVGRRARRSVLDSEVLYKRYGVYAVTPFLLHKIMAEKKLPQEFVQRGGRFVAIDGDALRRARLSLGMSKERLGQCIHVSARAVLAYERKETDVSTEVAERLEKVLETELVIPIDLFRETRMKNTFGNTEIPSIPENVSNLEKRVNEFFERLGMKVLWTDRAPFHMVAKEEGPPVLSTIGSLRNPGLLRRSGILKSVSEVAESDAVIIVEDGKAEQCVSDLPVIKQLELDEIEKPQELKRIIAERSEH